LVPCFFFHQHALDFHLFLRHGLDDHYYWLVIFTHSNMFVFIRRYIILLNL
jgi:hypothetical protein